MPEGRSHCAPSALSLRPEIDRNAESAVRSPRSPCFVSKLMLEPLCALTAPIVASPSSTLLCHSGQTCRGITGKESSLLGSQRDVLFLVLTVVLLQIYKSFIRPVLEYGSPVWGGLPRGLSDDLDRVQKTCLKICGLSPKQLPTLESRRREASVRELRRILKDPSHPCHAFIQPTEEPRYELRRRSQYKLPSKERTTNSIANFQFQDPGNGGVGGGFIARKLVLFWAMSAIRFGERSELLSPSNRWMFYRYVVDVPFLEKEEALQDAAAKLEEVVHHAESESVLELMREFQEVEENDCALSGNTFENKAATLQEAVADMEEKVNEVDEDAALDKESWLADCE
ncbi:tripeptidyl-peptidase II Tpp2 [Branchiostoma belcheri]|nr:tripeptidyl-peptidase II Tpp2 [Branchiostoma belcheri]